MYMQRVGRVRRLAVERHIVEGRERCRRQLLAALDGTRTVHTFLGLSINMLPNQVVGLSLA